MCILITQVFIIHYCMEQVRGDFGMDGMPGMAGEGTMIGIGIIIDIGITDIIIVTDIMGGIGTIAIEAIIGEGVDITVVIVGDIMVVIMEAIIVKVIKFFY